jgi:hypothetical protein
LSSIVISQGRRVCGDHAIYESWTSVCSRNWRLGRVRNVATVRAAWSTSPTNLKGPLAHAETRSEMICIEVRARTLVSPASTSTYPSYFDFFVFRLGTFFPCFRASERPIAIACFRLLTTPPLPPLPRFSAPFFRLRIAFSTVFEAPFEYFLAIVLLLCRKKCATSYAGIPRPVIPIQLTALGSFLGWGDRRESLCPLLLPPRAIVVDRKTSFA